MTDNEIRIAIAESLGWKPGEDDRFVVIPPNSPHSVQPLNTIPDYTKDLNACAEFEKKMSDSDFEEYFNELEEQVIFARPGEKRRHVCSATARQRCEAYLRTKGLWK